ncbi:hypothetical protein FHQ26_02955 [Testudinibacter sp. TR-2022]|uniref:hypothetical protein n=1 Tax=Testudinibacter sp. TR-2022 TaxID=2585029 RepID=UPI00111B32D8|nr:hypothetical protein [Testudinibacter sp. TR-2022]TNH01937.1 hypothetical protein FHQ22_10865 [Pasteurellaceae bacterium Phil31]TNH11023.1 hypothetical protein FHQ25_03660 [Testudinibacter sp. TR-2022]TNH11793.1 hypothetical protein FHQ26_02955 [Testudinibacter sp. TR-2022]TNH16412.1 hypothetical protein FHQ23_08685 [Testudinibacter sp. TR-2022]TNH16991.1 hypothetical protein FIA56_00745 [Testudinibacter sp. TR-2022]
MLPINLFYGLLILLILLPLIIFRFSRYKNSLKINRYLALGLVTLAALLWGAVNQLVVVTNDNQAREYALFFPQQYQLANQQQLAVPYQFGWRKATVINDSRQPLIYETVKYGSSEIEMQVIGILPYAMMKNLPEPISYSFSEPPSAVRLTFIGSDLRGWIHR